MTNKSILSVCFGMSLLFAWPLAGHAANDALSSEIAAKAGSAEVKVAELKQLLQAQGIEAIAQKKLPLAALDRLARTEAMRRLVANEARGKGWDKKEEVRASMARAAEEAMVADYLASETQPAAGYPSDKELQEAYQANKDSFRVPRQYHLQQIFVSQPDKGDKPALDKAQRIADEAAQKAREKNADFAAVARKYSDHQPSREQGGDMGWLGEAEIVPEVRVAALALGKGEVSKPVKSAQGWHILRMDDIKEAGVRSLDEVRAVLSRALRQRQAEENQRKFIDSLLQRNPVSVNEIALTKLGEAVK